MKDKILPGSNQSKRRSRFRNLVIILLTALFLAIIFQNVSLERLRTGFAAVGYPAALICLALHLLVFVFRTIPMAILMREVPFVQLLNSHLIHNFYLQILPANLGELSLPLLLASYAPRSKSLSTLFVARAYTTMVVLMLFLVSLLSLHGTAYKLTFDPRKSVYIVGCAIILGLTLALFAIPKLKHSNNRIINYGWLKLNNIFGKIREQLANSLTPIRLIIILISNLIYLFLMACFYQVLLHRLGISVNLMQQFFIMSIQVAMMLLPIKSVGNFGVVEGSWMLGLLVLGFGRSVALETGLIVHLVALLSAAFYFVIGLLLKNTLLKTPNTMNESVISI